MFSDSSVLVAGGSTTYVAGNVSHNSEETAFDRLCEHVTASALHNSGEVSDQPKCHPGTRVAILDHLVGWAVALTHTYPIIWLHGPAGAGKSAILRTIAQILFTKGLLVAGFFFFRAAAGRNSAENLIPTIAYQLAVNMPATRRHIEEAIERNPLIFSLSLWDQAEALLVSPILAIHENPDFNPHQSPRIIIVDGLDECRDPDKQCEILETLCRVCHALENLPIPFAVFVGSRPEHHIRLAFDLGDLNKSSSRLSLDNSYKPDTDIERFLSDRFSAIRKNHPLRSCLPTPPSPWPTPKVIAKLVQKASGQFIYASTVDKFISSSRHNPAKRLDIILGILDAGSLKPFEQLDLLYSTIFEIVDPEDLPGTLHVLGTLLIPCDAFTIRSPAFLERVLNLETGDVRRLLFDLESLLKINEDHYKEIVFFHASLSDYLFDKSRSGRFWIDARLIYAHLLQCIIVQISKSPRDTDMIEWFFKENSETLFSEATPTVELRQAIENYDFAHPKPSVIHYDLRLIILQGFRSSRFPNAEELYRTKYAIMYGETRQPQSPVNNQDTARSREPQTPGREEAAVPDTTVNTAGRRRIKLHDRLSLVFPEGANDLQSRRQAQLDPPKKTSARKSRRS